MPQTLSGVPCTKGLPIVRDLAVTIPPTVPDDQYVISGITRDQLGVVLGSCTVKLFLTEGNVLIGTTTSDPGTGAYSFTVGNKSNYYAVAYLASNPDVFGTTKNTLQGI